MWGCKLAPLMATPRPQPHVVPHSCSTPVPSLRWFFGCGFVTADGKHVAFGTVVSGQEVVTAISQLFHVDGKPLQDVVIADCGIVQ